MVCKLFAFVSDYTFSFSSFLSYRGLKFLFLLYPRGQDNPSFLLIWYGQEKCRQRVEQSHTRCPGPI